MNKEIEFLLKYAKIGVLYQRQKVDAIAKEELTQEFIRIKTKLLQKGSVEDVAIVKPSSVKKSVAKKWFQGIGDRQRKYKETHKGDLI